MTIQQLLERLIAISVIDPDAEILFEDDAGWANEIREVNYDRERRIFLVNGEDIT